MGENGSPLDIYEIEGTIGKGGGGTVLKAFHKRLQKPVVIKRIHDSVNMDERRTEVDILKNLRHSYLPQVLDYFVIDGVSYTVMDFIEGESFQTLLKKGVKFKESQVIKYGKQLCEAVEYLHSQKIPVIHGDIKPANIMLTPEDNICLIDFNISGISEGNQAYTIGFSKGYGAPEQEEAYARVRQNIAETQTGMPTMAEPVTATRLEVEEATPAQPQEKTEMLFSTSEKTGTEIISNPAAPMSTASVSSSVNSAMSGSLSGSSSVYGSVNPAYKIPIDKRTDVYSIGATLYHLYTGIRVDKDPKRVLSASTSEGYLYILNKALQTNPANRYASAGEMLKAFQTLHTKSRGYRRFVATQVIVRGLFFLGMLAGIGLFFYGSQRIRTEKNDLYAGYIDELVHFTEKNAEAKHFDSVYDEAVELFPERTDAYFQKAQYLYSAEAYTDDIDYIQTVLDNSVLYNSFSDSEIGILYYLQGNSFYALDDYKNAKAAYDNAIKIDPDNGNVYVDHAIVCAKLGKLDKAQESMEIAKKKKADESNLSLVEGEVAFAMKDYATAEEKLKACIATTSDDYRKMCAYSTCNKAILNGDSRTLADVDESIAFLQKGLSDVAPQYRNRILEMLADSYLFGHELGGGEAYTRDAISTYDELIKVNWDGIQTYRNITLLYMALKEYDSASSYVQTMEDRYPDSYVTYKIKAFLEFEIQSEASHEERNFETFYEAYLKAKELFDAQSKDKADPEMQVLDKEYKQLVDNNLL